MLEPGRWRLQRAEIAPLHSSLGDRARLSLKKKRKEKCESVSRIGGFLVSLTSRMKPRTFVVLQMVCPEFVPSGVQMCPEFLPSGGLVVSLTSGVKPWTLVVSVTALKGGASGVVHSFQ